MKAPSGRVDPLLGLVDDALGGSEPALRTLVRSVTPKILSVVRRVLGSHHPDVEDVTQESTLAFVQALTGFERGCTVSHFARRIAVQRAMNHRRAAATQKRGGLVASDEPLEDIAARSHEPEGRIDGKSAVQAVRELMCTLPSEQAEALVLHSVNGFTIGEIASSTGTAHETIRSRLRLARRALRRRLTGGPALTLVESES